MDNEVQNLIQKANRILSQSELEGRARYTQELKNIVADLRNIHKLSVKQIADNIPISSFSAREWPKRKKPEFNKVSIIKQKKPEFPTKIAINYSNELIRIISNLKVLKVLLALLIFESIVFHLIFLRIQMVQ